LGISVSLVLGGVPDNASNGTGRDRHPTGNSRRSSTPRKDVGSVCEHVVDLLTAEQLVVLAEISDIVLTHVAGDLPALLPKTGSETWGAPMEKMVSANGVDLCVETFGDQRDPAILLIHGASASMDYWEVPFCERLAAGPRFVIRYDARDTGRSVSYEPGKPEYGPADLVADAAGVLDAVGVARAHVVGISMGGGFAQRLVVDFPDKVASVTLISTSPDGPGGPSDPKLPPMSAKLRAMFGEEAPAPDWSDREVALQRLIDDEKLYAGTLPFDEQARRQLLGRMIDRTRNLAAAMTNHWLLEGGEPARSRLRQIGVPALVLHGTEDPLFPLGHGEALAREIPGARLVPLEHAGHELPEPVWDVAIPEILAITALPDRRAES
jgi:pimeloyl-ACP methyl ester carboxylesterase